MKFLSCYGLLLLLLLLCFHEGLSWSTQFNQAENYEGSSDLVSLQYHMGPVLASAVNLYIIWYGQWSPTHQGTIRDFIDSLSSSSSVPYPSVADWWQTVRLYTDQTGSNITGSISLSGEFYDTGYSHGIFLSRLSMQSVIKTAVTSRSRPLPLDPHKGLYLVLTSDDVRVEDFCRAVCGFHYFTFPMVVGVTVPYAWVGYSGSQCPGMCAYPFAWPKYSGKPPPSNDIMRSPNGDAGVDGMISVIAHELAEVSSNPLVNAWYAGDDPTAPTEIADLCLGLYGSGGGGGYVGKVYKDAWGNGYNVNGVGGRRFLVQWVWNPVKGRCFGPNAMD
ncbi:Protein EXORDIUM-like 7 [Hibiscus syriacus]|uniref:Protein EXORDIUM-like 7 n=1 Tax=Hibiscus syriacus TaxID=106335 RepID=A0A6A3AY20_HIBSY|nr:protein EXORDIUM-like 7 [Hibiscus syriacus]KAE8707955.1 Protein EXORDIUM-like 7 [Hibiscus syriacus]